MSKENVEVVRRVSDAYNRRDVGAMLDEEAFSEIQAEQTQIRDLGERVVAIGHLRGRGSESGAITESAIAWIVEFKSGKVIRVREYLDPKKALEAAGLRE